MQNYSNTAVQTSLSGSVTSGSVNLIVDSTIGFPSVNFTLAVDPGTASEELVLVTGVAGNTLTVTRGYDGTTAVSHDTGAVVLHVHSAKDFADSRAHEAATSNVHGVTGALVGVSNAQTLTNKTISAASNTIGGMNGGGAAFVVTNNAGQLDGTGAVIKSYPSGAVVGTTDAQTLSNKTLTAPALTAPTATGSLAGFGGAWTSYTPTWTVLSGTNPAIGNGSIVGAYMQVGKTVHFRIKITLGSTSTAGTGAYLFGLPVAAHAAYTANSALLATGGALDTGVAIFPAVARVNSSTTVLMDVTTTGAPISSTAPFAPGSGDTYTVSGTYEAA